MPNILQDNTNIYNASNENAEPSSKIESDIMKSYHIGQIICGKVGKFPWWPCMVAVDENGRFYKQTDSKVEILVSYFGKSREYSYLSSNKILNVQSKQQFDNYLVQGTIRSSKQVAPHHKESLKFAWEEAEKALQMSVIARMEEYGIKCEIKAQKSSRRSKKSSGKPASKQLVTNKPLPKEKEPLKYAFEELDMPYSKVRMMEKCCHYCFETKDVVECVKKCGTRFHIKCADIFRNSIDVKVDDVMKCLKCSIKKVSCYACFESLETDNSSEILQCSISSCSRWFHSSCVESGPLYEMTRWPVQNKLVCPRHLCHRCELVSPFPKYKCKRLVVCIMCPAAFHTGDWCLPAGSYELTSKEIICPRHLLGGQYGSTLIFPPFIGRMKSVVQYAIYGDNLSGLHDKVLKLSGHSNKPINVNWCFKCSEGGNLICCESCPAAYHLACASLKEIPNNYYCFDCVAGCFRSYGEIVWIKCGSYRWWPGQIMHIANAPKNIVSRFQSHGQFVVQFFGTREYIWTDSGRVFVYEEEDKEHIWNPEFCTIYE